MDKLKLLLFAWTEPYCWLIDKRAQTILDVGCGNGLPMLLIKMRMNPKKTVGVDIFDSYLKEAKKARSHSELLKNDIRKLPFKDKSFDVAISLQVLEHLNKKEALRVLEKIEKIAKKQIIISTPYGEMKNKIVDNNRYMLHKSYFMPSDFEKRGYRVMLWGSKKIDNILYRTQTPLFFKKIVILLFRIYCPIYLLFPKLGNFYLYAIKEIDYK